MKRGLLLAAAAVAALVLLFPTAAFDTPEGSHGEIELSSADGPNGIYAVEDGGELRLDISEGNQELAKTEGGEGINDNTVTTIDDIFTIEYSGDDIAEVWVTIDRSGTQLDSDELFFYAEGDLDTRFTDETDSIELGDGAANGETINVGLYVDTTSEHNVEALEQFTVHAEGPDDGDQVEESDGDDQETEGPDDDGQVEDDDVSVQDDDQEAETDEGEDSTEPEGEDEDENEEQGEQEDETDPDESGDGDSEESEDGSAESDDEDGPGESDPEEGSSGDQPESEQDGEEDDPGADETPEDTEQQQQQTDDGSGGEGVTDQSPGDGPIQTLGALLNNTLLTLLVALLTGASVVALARYVRQ